MNKKKITALLVAGVLTVGIVGGTLAWFTSQDTVTNHFTTTQSDPGKKGNDGLDIYEYFDTTNADKAIPGTAVDKKVQVQNQASYNQFIRVKLTPVWTSTPNRKNDKGELLDVKDADNTLITLNTAALTTKAAGTWFKDGDYYYYIGYVSTTKFTPLLLNSVTISGAAGNEYKDAKYDVKVEAESIQADNTALQDKWGSKKDDGTYDATNSAAVEAMKVAGVKDNDQVTGTTATGSTTEYGTK